MPNHFLGVQYEKLKQPIVYALGLSLFTHVIVFTVKWHQESERERRLKTPLSVVLVNAHSTQSPTHAKRLAQADLNGGGQLKDAQASALRRADPALAERLEKMESEQKKLLAQLNAGRVNDQSTLSVKNTKTQKEENSLEAELSKRLVKEGAQPRRAAVTATSAKAVIFAHYYDAMRKQIEAYGTTHFPRIQGKVLYGSLVLMVSVDHRGQLIKDGIVVMKSSGNQELDRQAVAIIRSAAPFGRFTDGMHSQIDVLDWVSTFEFTRDGGELKLDLKN
jgi:protein TonB